MAGYIKFTEIFPSEQFKLRIYRYNLHLPIEVFTLDDGWDFTLERAMAARLKKFLHILEVEFEDLTEDIIMLQELTEERHEQREISHYVHMENKGVLIEEKAGIDLITSHLKNINPDEFASCEDIRENILSATIHMIEHGGYPKAVIELVKRKVDKAMRYIQE